ncbi:unnamed protein product, partial [Rotaria magnacalcarata]
MWNNNTCWPYFGDLSGMDSSSFLGFSNICD